MPKSYLKPEEREGLSENAVYLFEASAATDADDMETSWEWLKKAEIPAHTLLAYKRTKGAAWIREKGFKTDTAEKEYGRDWLDREI